MKPGTKGLTRTGFARKPPAPAGDKKPAPRSTLKASRPKSTKIRQSANGEECTIRLKSVCVGGTDTTVWCHSNRAADGKGAGLKSADHRGAYGCWKCHAVYDRQMSRPAGMTLEYVEDQFTIGMSLSAAILKAKGLAPEEAAA